MEHEKSTSSSPQKSPLLLGLLGTLFSAFVVWSLSKLSNPDQESGGVRHPRNNPDNTTPDGQPLASLPFRVVIDSAPPIPTPSKERKARDYRQERRDKRRLCVEIIGTCLLVAYTVVTGFMWRTTNESAKAAKESADIAKDTLIASNRPWMTAEIQITGPLTFNKSGAQLPLTYILKNTGHSPAISVWSDEELYLPVNPQRDTETERARLCSDTVKRSVNMGQAIFPQVEFKGGIVTAVSDEAVQKAKASGVVGFLNPSIIVCIAYQSTIEKDMWHYTGIVYDIWRLDEKGIRFAIKADKELPLKELRFGYSPFRGVLAN